jgi:hypothetical protein
MLCQWEEIQNTVKPGVVVHVCNPSIQEAEKEDFEFKARLGYTGRSYLKAKQNKYPVNYARQVLSLL